MIFFFFFVLIFFAIFAFGQVKEEGWRVRELSFSGCTTEEKRRLHEQWHKIKWIKRGGITGLIILALIQAGFSLLSILLFTIIFWDSFWIAYEGNINMMMGRDPFALPKNWHWSSHIIFKVGIMLISLTVLILTI